MTTAQLRAGLALAALLLGTGPAFAGDPIAGRDLAGRWCTSCHAVGTRDKANDTAPPFTAIVNTRQRSDDWIRGWLANPHPPMPNPGLGRYEIENIVSYFAELRRAGAPGK